MIFVRIYLTQTADMGLAPTYKQLASPKSGRRTVLLRWSVGAYRSCLPTVLVTSARAPKRAYRSFRMHAGEAAGDDEKLHSSNPDHQGHAESWFCF